MHMFSVWPLVIIQQRLATILIIYTVLEQNVDLMKVPLFNAYFV